MAAKRKEQHLSGRDGTGRPGQEQALRDTNKIQCATSSCAVFEAAFETSSLHHSQQHLRQSRRRASRSRVKPLENDSRDTSIARTRYPWAATIQISTGRRQQDIPLELPHSLLEVFVSRPKG